MTQSRAAVPVFSCLLGLIIFGILASCMVPSVLFLGGFAATLGSDVVAAVVDDFLCPAGSTGEIITYQVIPRRNSYDYEMQCVDASGTIVRAPSPDYALYWSGFLAVAAVILAGITSLLLAVLLGATLGRRRSREKRPEPL